MERERDGWALIRAICTDAVSYTHLVLAQLLAKQRKVYWVLGDCDFSYAYQYSVENEYPVSYTHLLISD